MSDNLIGSGNSSRLTGFSAILRDYFTQHQGHLVTLSSDAGVASVLLHLFNELDLRSFSGLSMLVEPARLISILESFPKMEAPPSFCSNVSWEAMI